uniref:Lipase-like C-terminal domain-containing protein n=1 Tax=Globisporangium ultimum (strain ATCC 200006 / CBS 805.95 / DAOM BR144) TaxID=431595 RepID=K3WXL5_GLOUD
MVQQQTKFPVVLIHGVFGYGRERPAWSCFPPYWPESHLQQLNPNHIIVDVGVASSDHDRACEMFYQLRGGTVDYGEEHAKHTTHARYGAVYETARHPNWSELNPIHLVGHSLGALTALEFYQLVSADFFGVGSNYKWVRSITSIAGPLTGSTLTHMVGLHDTTMTKGSLAHLLYIALAMWAKLHVRVPFLRRAYDFRMDQWNEHSFSQLVAVDGPINQSMDSGFYSILPSRRVQLNAQLKHMDKLHLMSIVTSPKTCHVPVKEASTFAVILLFVWGKFPRWWPSMAKTKPFRSIAVLLFCWSLWKQVEQLDVAKLPSLYGLKWLMRRTAKALPKIFDGYEAHQWQHNDGAVNIHSQLRPWFPKPHELSTTTATERMDPHTKTVVGTLASSRSKALHAVDSVPLEARSRCDSHISISDFHHDADETGVKEAAAEEETRRQATQRFIKGRWYVYRVDSNHFAGTYWDCEARNLYKSLFVQMVNEYENESDSEDCDVKDAATSEPHGRSLPVAIA